MDPNKDDETVYLLDSVTQPVLDVFNSIMSKMAVDISIQNIGYRLSDQKESVWTRINSIEDFSRAIEAQHDIQSHAFKSKHLRIINKVCSTTCYSFYLILTLYVRMQFPSSQKLSRKTRRRLN